MPLCTRPWLFLPFLHTFINNTCCLIAAACPITNYRYAGTQFSDAYGKSSYARVHPDFVKYMNDMNGYAKTCGVKVRKFSRCIFSWSKILLKRGRLVPAFVNGLWQFVGVVALCYQHSVLLILEWHNFHKHCLGFFCDTRRFVVAEQLSIRIFSSWWNQPIE